jgi:hypothetical protein
MYTCRESFQPTTAATGTLLLLFPRLFINFERNLLLFVLCTAAVCLSVGTYEEEQQQEQFLECCPYPVAVETIVERR